MKKRDDQHAEDVRDPGRGGETEPERNQHSADHAVGPDEGDGDLGHPDHQHDGQDNGQDYQKAGNEGACQTAHVLSPVATMGTDACRLLLRLPGGMIHHRRPKLNPTNA